jgi:hypothetical protein
MNRIENLMPSPRNPPPFISHPNDHWSKKVRLPGFKEEDYIMQRYNTMKFGGLRGPPIPPGNPREQLYEDGMIGLKKGGKAKKKKKELRSSKSGMSQSQKINIKIGDFSKLLEKKKDDTAMLMKSSAYQPMPSSHTTYMRLESPQFKYAQPLPSVIPNLYQANPSSISTPLVSAQPTSSKGGDLQPKINVPVVVDTDPNDLQKNQIRDPIVRAVPSQPSVSGSLSGIVGTDNLGQQVSRPMSLKESLSGNVDEYRDYYLDEGGYIISRPYDEKKVVRTGLSDDMPYSMTMSEKDRYIPKSDQDDTGPLQFSSRLTQYPVVGQGQKSRQERELEERFRYLVPESSASSASSSSSSSVFG